MELRPLPGSFLQNLRSVLVGGAFTTSSNPNRDFVCRLNSDGTVDTTFNFGADGAVCAVVLQPDGRIVIAGDFTVLNGQARNRIARLNADGSLDTLFNPGADAGVSSLTEQPDGRILVGGTFRTLGGQSRNYLGRLNVDGSVDTTFNPGANSYVHSLVVQDDGKILAGGFFTLLAGHSQTYFGRLNADGSFDSSFTPVFNGGGVWSLVPQADGKILLGGNFAYVRRVNSDGSLDPAFDAVAKIQVDALAMQPDGSILYSSYYTPPAGEFGYHIVRLNNTSAPTGALRVDGPTISWGRGGTAPQVWRTSMEASTNGMDWINLGAGTPEPGGWQLTGVALPTNAIIRARGYIAEGRMNGSGWFVETCFPSLRIFSQPASLTNYAGTSASFGVTAAGTAPLNYQWLKNGVPLSDSGFVSGSHAATLSLSNVLGADAGYYSVLASNISDTVTSQVAALTVLDPFISSQPADRTVNAGQPATFTTTTPGTLPLGYQWYKDGNAIATATSSALTLTNCQRADAGRYWVIVTNQFGSATSRTAILTVNSVILDTGFNPSANGSVFAMAFQADGKALLGGTFTTLGGQTRNYIGRLNVDGSLDTSFNPGANSYVYSLAVQFDGKILVGGGYTTLGSQARNYLGRLNADGSVDTTFNPGANSHVYSLALQADGKILVGGAFSALAGQSRSYLGRLNANGSADLAFNPGANSWVYSLALQSDGGILVGGYFTKLAGDSRSYFGRLSPAGILDAEFNPAPNSSIYSLAVQADGKILAGGGFATMAGQARANIA
jgi:uncharacterized delta-60 repeat protein